MKISLKKPRVIAIAGALILAILIGFFWLKSRSTSVPINLKTAKAVKVVRGNIRKDLVLAGKIDAASFANLQFQTAGKLAWVGVKEGDFVRKGQAIASLDTTLLKKQRDTQLNNFLSNRWNFEDTQDQYKPLKDRFLITTEIQRTLDRAQFSLNNAVLSVESASKQLNDATINSPISGIITEIDAPIAGANIVPADAVITVIDPSSIYFKANIDEIDVSGIKVGQSATINIDSYPDSSIETRVSSISFTPVQGETSTVYQVKFCLSSTNSDLKYRLGMNGDVNIKLAETSNVLYLPVEAVYEEGGNQFVYSKNSQSRKIEKVPVKTGLASDSIIEIIEGLSEGQEVLVSSSS